MRGRSWEGTEGMSYVIIQMEGVGGMNYIINHIIYSIVYDVKSKLKEGVDGVDVGAAWRVGRA